MPRWANRSSRPTITSWPSTDPRAPRPGMARNRSAWGSDPSSARAAALTAPATGCPDACSTAPAYRSRASRLSPAAATTPVTAMTPVVTVPVLSSTTVSTAREDSSAWYLLMKIPSCAPRPQATISAAGVASPSAHGHAMISTASAALNARSAGAAREQPAGQRQGRRHQHGGHEDAADPVGEPLDGRLLRLGLLDQGDQVRELGVAAHLDRADHQPPGHHHRARGDQVALGDVGRHRLPGHHAGVHRGLAELHLPVGGDPFPGPHHEPLPRTQLRDRDPALGPVSVQDARIPGARRGQLPHRVPGIAPRPGLIQPARQQERRHRRGDLQVDPAPGSVQQQVRSSSARAWPRSSTNIAYTDQPHAAVMPSDTSVSIDDRAMPGVPQRGLRGTATPTRPPPAPPARSGPTASPGTGTTGTATAAPTGQLSGTNNTSATISRRRR